MQVDFTEGGKVVGSGEAASFPAAFQQLISASECKATPLPAFLYVLCLSRFVVVRVPIRPLSLGLACSVPWSGGLQPRKAEQRRLPSEGQEGACDRPLLFIDGRLYAEKQTSVAITYWAGFRFTCGSIGAFDYIICGIALQPVHLLSCLQSTMK